MLIKILPVIALIIGLAGGYFVGAGSGAADGGNGKNVCPLPEKPAVPDKSKLELAATPIMQNLVAAFKDGDHKAYKKDYIPDLAMDENAFKAYCEAFKLIGAGTAGFRWIGDYNKGGTIVTLWKISGRDGDVLVTMSLLKRENKYFVVGFFTS